MKQQTTDIEDIKTKNKKQKYEAEGLIKQKYHHIKAKNSLVYGAKKGKSRKKENDKAKKEHGKNQTETKDKKQKI